MTCSVEINATGKARSLEAGAGTVSRPIDGLNAGSTPAPTLPSVEVTLRPIAALFVQTGGHYFGLDGVDPWDVTRDALTYGGPHPVVAHPPCTRWCQLAYVVQKRRGLKVGDDGGTFASALASVRRWGGVLEHPAFSYAWPAFGLTRPPRVGWQRCADGAWVCQVSQSAYGHKARKRTWLYYVGDTTPASMQWGEPAPTAQVSWCKNHGNSPLPRLSKKEASRTPIEFRDALIALARNARTPKAPDLDGAFIYPADLPADMVGAFRGLFA